MVEPRARKYHRDRVAETLREEISGMIVGELADPRISFAYVSEVVLNPGGKSARVYIAVDGGEVEEEKTREALTAARGFIRREPDPLDRRRVLVRLTIAGERVLHNLSLQHRAELQSAAPALLAALRAVID